MLQAIAPWLRRFNLLAAGKNRLDTLFVPLVLAVVCGWLAATNGVFLSTGNLRNVLSQMVMLAIVAFGGTFVILSREIDLSVGAGAALVSVVGAGVMTATGSVPEGLIAGIGAGITVGVVNGLVVAILEVPSFIATLGMMVILRGLSLHWTNGGIISGLPPALDQLANQQLLGLPYIVWLMVVVFVVLYAVQRQTTFGLRVFAVGGNPEAARLAGIPVKKVRFLCFVTSGITMGLAGMALLLRVESGQPNGAYLLELYSIAAIVIGGTSLFGGRGSITRTLWGVLLIEVLQNGLDLIGAGFDYQQMIIGTVFIAAASVDFVRRRLSTQRRGAVGLSLGAKVKAGWPWSGPATSGPPRNGPPEGEVESTPVKDEASDRSRGR
jgi:ribose transport system permease protein